MALPLTASAALRYWNMAWQRHCRRLARNGKPAASLLTPSSSEPRTPAGKAQVLDARKWLRERDGLSAGGEWIRTSCSAREALPRFDESWPRLRRVEQNRPGNDHLTPARRGSLRQPRMGIWLGTYGDGPGRLLHFTAATLARLSDRRHDKFDRSDCEPSISCSFR